MTPVKNEAWILERFLKCASMWADHIIIADQGSTDGTREIAERFRKVRLIKNESKEFNEPERQKLLIDEARKIPGPRLLITLDADEFLSADFKDSPEWELMLRANPGTVIRFPWLFVMPDRVSYFKFADMPFGFMDDGNEHQGKAIHSPRIPMPKNATRMSLKDTKVLHLGMIDWKRYESKVRWYQCLEFLKRMRGMRPVQLYQFYHALYSIPEGNILPLSRDWIDFGMDVDLFKIVPPEYFWWDEEIIKFLAEHGTKKFGKLAIWDVDWSLIYKSIHHEYPVPTLQDPRSFFERWMHDYLAKIQKYHLLFPSSRDRIGRYFEELFEKMVSLFGW